ncbi:hypothetical protein K151_2720 [Proteus hauseri ZMd44]|nr:hypothetical protein K151_2720 [Proteus hauseri ZMd44]
MSFTDNIIIIMRIEYKKQQKHPFRVIFYLFFGKKKQLEKSLLFIA